MSARLRVVVDPHFRAMDEIFTPADRAELHELVDVVWGLDRPMPRDDFLREVTDADAVVFGGWRYGAEALDATTSRLRALLEVAGGHEHADLDYDRCLDRGIAVGSCAPAFGPTVSEMALALALSSMRGVTQADRLMRRRSEQWLHAGNQGNTSLHGASVGFVGCGRISVHLQRLLDPFGTKVLGYDPPISDEILLSRGIVPASLETIMAAARVIFILAAPTVSNHGLISRRLLRMLTPDQTLVLLSRARLVDFDALVELVAQRRFRVAIDVYPDEPLDPDHPVRALDWAVLAPHLAGAMPAALLEIGRMVVADLQALARGRRPTAMQYLTSENRAGLVQESAVHRDLGGSTETPATPRSADLGFTELQK